VGVLTALALASAAVASASSPTCGGERLADANAHYAALVQAMDSTAIGQMYLPGGRIMQGDGSALIGPARIAAFLDKFRNFRVSAETMEIAAIAGQPHRRWRVTGRYHQQGATPAGAKYSVAGTYAAVWACRRNGWRLATMETTPDKGPA